MITLLAVLIGGFAGAIARQEGFSALQERASTRFPVGILAVNLSGAFVLGLLFGLGIASAWPRWVATGVQTGFIGAYTSGRGRITAICSCAELGLPPRRDLRRHGPRRLRMVARRLRRGLDVAAGRKR